MSVRSVDVQNAIARTQEVERVQRAQNDAARIGQQAFAAELSQRAEEKSRQVTSPPRAEEGKVRDENEQRGKESKDSGEGKAQGTPDRAETRAGAGDGGGVNVSQGGEAGPSEAAIPGRIIDVEV